MKNYIIPVERIKKAQLRYFDGNGTLVPDIKACTLFIKNDETYINLFNFVSECNVYERLPYSNNTRDGEDYGTKIRLVSGKEEKGLCVSFCLSAFAQPQSAAFSFCTLCPRLAG